MQLPSELPAIRTPPGPLSDQVSGRLYTVINKIEKHSELCNDANCVSEHSRSDTKLNAGVISKPDVKKELQKEQKTKQFFNIFSLGFSYFKGLNSQSDKSFLISAGYKFAMGLSALFSIGTLGIPGFLSATVVWGLARIKETISPSEISSEEVNVEVSKQLKATENSLKKFSTISSISLVVDALKPDFEPLGIPENPDLINSNSKPYELRSYNSDNLDHFKVREDISRGDLLQLIAALKIFKSSVNDEVLREIPIFKN